MVSPRFLGEGVGLTQHHTPLVSNVSFDGALEDEVGEDALQLVQLHLCTVHSQRSLAEYMYTHACMNA